MSQVEKINSILEEILALDSPIINEGKKKSIFEFLKIVVNGDSIKSHLVINASLGKDASGALVYILTDARLITVSITDSGEPESSSYKLDTMVGISRKLDEGRMQIRVSFQSDKVVGLKYPMTSEHITDFFQKIDQEQSEDSSDGV